MTALDTPPPLEPSPAAPMPGLDDPPRPPRGVLQLIGQMLAILGTVLLCFVVQLSLVGTAQHDRDQSTAYDDFRRELANGTAPVGALVDGRLLDSGTSVAILEIPRIGVREVVAEGTSARTLKSGPGHLRNTPMPGQAGTSVIYGRRATYGGPFALLDKLRSGDEIIVTTGQGESRYVVQGVRRANDKERPALQSGQGRLTLVTADGSYYVPSDILRVDARLSSEAFDGNRRLPAFAVPDDEKAMVGDASALTPLALWILVLAAAAVAVVLIRHRLGRWHAWVIGAPVLGVVGLTLADATAGLLPNLM
ncbi:sortase [Actinokineospora auranticolor]|uniref:LPXTG-site transpeptidase (Sortase) family protein n=1 Tax=Actinokineospora auranticolor TaxID=155976 RepID=A0A2S6GUM8_9PSEU|nr:sortase [Actinokineospora auranticolor]PPK68899.1 LPXTG-site transpeptidase (sortase) family protein [Actinokineospora auranticolor]